MKLGIITFHRAINYGAVMQAYALNTVTKNLGFESEIVDYGDNKIENDYKLFKRKKIKKLLSDLYYFPIKYNKYKKFQKFLNTYTNLSEKYNSKNIEESNNKYDIFLTGSDQVFNYIMTGEDDNYYLSFVKIPKKINSYSASFGSDFVKKEHESKIQNLLLRFSNISVREKNAIEIVKKVSGRNSRLDVDPTFLISKENWEALAKEPKEKKYILLFVMQKNKSIYKFAEELSKRTNLEIIYVADSYKKMVNGKHKTTLSPEEWLGYIKCATYVVTNSFHGLCFSIILNKKFYIQLQKEPAPGNSRLKNLLEEYGLENRLINYCENNINDEINWNSINYKIKLNKDISLKYLESLKNE